MRGSQAAHDLSLQQEPTLWPAFCLAAVQWNREVTPVRFLLTRFAEARSEMKASLAPTSEPQKSTRFPQHGCFGFAVCETTAGRVSSFCTQAAESVRWQNSATMVPPTTQVLEAGAGDGFLLLEWQDLEGEDNSCASPIDGGYVVVPRFQYASTWGDELHNAQAPRTRADLRRARVVYFVRAHPVFRAANPIPR